MKKNKLQDREEGNQKLKIFTNQKVVDREKTNTSSRKHESQRSRSEELQGTILPPNSESMKDDNGDN